MQYAARFNADKLKKLLHKQHRDAGGSLSARNFNMRLVSEDVSARLTGFEHNAVSPIGLATPDLPIILSHRCSSLCISVSSGLQNSFPNYKKNYLCLLYTSPSPRDGLLSRMPSSA